MISNQLILSIFTFVTQVSGMGVEIPPPESVAAKIKFVSQERLEELYFVEEFSAQEEVGALYDHFDGTIYLSSRFVETDPLEVSFLVHEIVHMVQDLQGRIGSRQDYRDLDFMAYSIQAQWLRKEGLKREAFLMELQAQLKGYSQNFH